MKLINFILFIWELPQNLFGLVLYMITRYKKKVSSTSKARYRLFIEAPFGISLGYFVFWHLNDGLGNRMIVREHEYGHSIQSRMLGPFYLPIVGLPSLLRVFYAYLYAKRNKRRWQNYFGGFPENWADRLGRIDRNRNTVHLEMQNPPGESSHSPGDFSSPGE